MLTLWNINDDDNNVVIIVIPCEPASLGCPIVKRDTVLLTCWVVCGSGDTGMPVIPTCCWSSFRAWLSLSSLLGVCSHLFGAGRQLPVIVLFARGYQVVGQGHCFGQLRLFVVVWLA